MKLRARFELDPLDGALLLVVALSVVPGVRTLAAWPTIWFVPGWFFVRRVLGVDGFARWPLEGALVVAPANDPIAIDPIEGLAERRVYDGFAFHLALTISEAERRALDAVNQSLLRGPDALADAREQVDYVVLRADDASGNDAPSASRARGWTARPPAFANETFLVYKPLR